MTKPLGELSRELEGGHGGAHTASHAFRLRRDRFHHPPKKKLRSV